MPIPPFPHLSILHAPHNTLFISPHLLSLCVCVSCYAHMLSRFINSDSYTHSHWLCVRSVCTRCFQLSYQGQKLHALECHVHVFIFSLVRVSDSNMVDLHHRLPGRFRKQCSINCRVRHWPVRLFLSPLLPVNLC